MRIRRVNRRLVGRLAGCCLNDSIPLLCRYGSVKCSHGKQRAYRYEERLLKIHQLFLRLIRSRTRTVWTAPIWPPNLYKRQIVALHQKCTAQIYYQATCRLFVLPKLCNIVAHQHPYCKRKQNGACRSVDRQTPLFSTSPSVSLQLSCDSSRHTQSRRHSR